MCSSDLHNSISQCADPPVVARQRAQKRQQKVEAVADDQGDEDRKGTQKQRHPTNFHIDEKKQEHNQRNALYDEYGDFSRQEVDKGKGEITNGLGQMERYFSAFYIAGDSPDVVGTDEEEKESGQEDIA